MKCPDCGLQLDNSCLFCKNCGKKLAKIVTDQINQEIGSALQQMNWPRIQTSQSTRTQFDSIKINDHTNKTEISCETDDVKKKQYKELLKDVFADGVVTAEEMVILANKLKELGLDKDEALKIQEDVAKEMNFNIDEEGDLISSGIILEINTRKSYFIDDMDDIEFKLTNISDEYIESAHISGYLINLKSREEKSIGKFKPSNKKTVYLPFCHNRRGNETVELSINFIDSRGNPSVYTSEFRVRVLSREVDKIGTESISITISAEKIMGNDFSDLANILRDDKSKEIENKSSYEENDKWWVRLPVFFDEDSTNRKRGEILIGRKLHEGDSKLTEAKRLQKVAETMASSSAKGVLKSAYNLLRESEECFRKIREIDPENAASLQGFKEVNSIICDIEGKIGTLENGESVVPLSHISSGCLTIKGLQKMIYLFSKNRITLGRDSKNDIVLRLIPYQPQEKYPENWQKCSMISSMHAELINKTGQFYIKDIGSSNAGSANGTYIDGKRLVPLQEYPIYDEAHISVANVLDLEFRFCGEDKVGTRGTQNLTNCYTVLDDVTDSCFGVDKRSSVNAIKIKRMNNYCEGEKYIVLIREVSIGRSKLNGISVDNDKMSDIHAKLFYRNNQYWIEDLNSRYGTWVNGKECPPGQETSLGTSSEIVLGDVQIHFEGYV